MYIPPRIILMSLPCPKLSYSILKEILGVLQMLEDVRSPVPSQMLMNAPLNFVRMFPQCDKALHPAQVNLYMTRDH